MQEELAIEIRNATVKLEGFEALHDFSWSVRRGERWFVLGPNGAGKTTLVKLMLGLVWPLYGATVSVLGNRYGSCDIYEIRKRVAWASPFLNTWASDPTYRRWTALEIVLSGIDSTVGFFRTASPEEIERAHAALEMIQGGAIADRYFDRLSSGEQVKAIIARALISDPELVILDETCVYLDLTSREILLKAIDDLASRPNAPTMVFITQRIEEITKNFNRGMILKDGRIFTQGSRDEILSEHNLEQTFGMPLKLEQSSNGRIWPVLR